MTPCKPKAKRKEFWCDHCGTGADTHPGHTQDCNRPRKPRKPRVRCAPYAEITDNGLQLFTIWCNWYYARRLHAWLGHALAWHDAQKKGKKK